MTESLNNIDYEESVTTKGPVQPESAENVDDRLHELALKHEIQEELAERLRVLLDYEIIILCDDSGSMKTTVDNTNRTRWDELRDFVKIILEVGTIFDSTGVDIYFLNRRPIYHVTNPNSVDDVFSDPPRGYTPLVRALRYISLLPAARRETTHVMFLICTDDSSCVDYLNEWDRKMINVDVTDDFRTEKERIRRCQGPHYPFSKGNYIVKALIGAIDPEIDNLNEPHLANAH